MSYRVYVSSTAKDLLRHREAVLTAIRRMDGVEPVSMEDYTAESMPPVERCVKDVAEADIYVGMFAYRYGTVPPDSERSITESELRAAEEHGKPRLIFVMHEDHPWPNSQMDDDQTKIKSLRRELCERYMADMFGDEQDLAAKLATSLPKTINEIRKNDLPVGPPQETGESAADQLAQAALAPYLKWLISKHDQLELRGLHRAGGGVLQVPLEKIYAALKADQTNPLERAEARRELEAELREAIENGEFTEDEVQNTIWYFVAGSPLMPSLELRDRIGAGGHEVSHVLNLGEACQQNQKLVILGDPGSGKTTVARWLVLVTAKALLAGDEQVSVPTRNIDPDAVDDDLPFYLGSPRLPVLVRISEYADDRRHAAQNGTRPRSLTEFLGYHSWMGLYAPWDEQPAGQDDDLIPFDALNRIIRDHLEQGRALIVLDGLDEIPDSSLRDEIVEEVDGFARRWIASRYSIAKEAGAVVGQIAQAVGEGNQLVVTSRIAGYHASPLRGDLTHVTVESMTDRAVDHFIGTWMREVHLQERGPDDSDESVLERAKLETASLCREIRSTTRRGVRELVSNPLLASVLATVFHTHDGNLPAQRAELYRIAVENLVNIWMKRQGNEDETEMRAFELYDVLEPLAAHIHQHEPTGLLPENELRELATRFLAESRGEHPLRPSTKLKGAVESLIRVLREDVGLLAARGEGVYGFLHLSFQEYLAARFLVRDLDTAASNLMSRVEDARWREAIMMALGHASMTSPDGFHALVRNVLEYDGSLRDLFPQSALQLVDALPEVALPEKEGESIELLVDICERLLLACEDEQNVNRLPSRENLIERAFRQLIEHGYERGVERCFWIALTSHDPTRPNRAAAAAAVLRRLDWITPMLAGALIQALPHDRAAWNWPICGLLRELVTPPSPEIPKSPRKPAPDPRLSRHEAELEQATDEATRQDLKLRIARLKEQAEAIQADYKAQEEEYNARQKQLLSSESPLAVELPLGDLPMRFALQQSPDLVDRIVSDHQWNRLIVALYGGYRDYHTPDSIREYHQIAAYLQLESGERDPFATYYRETWDRDDPVYDMAVYLDERSKLLKHQWRLAPEFRVSCLYRDSYFTPEIISALSEQRPAAELKSLFQRHWDEGDEPHRQAEALLGLFALGDDVRSALDEDSDRARFARRRITQLKTSLQDPASRATQNVLDSLKDFSEGLEPEAWLAASEATFAMANQAGALPMRVQELFSVFPEEACARLMAEAMVQNVCGWGDDVVYTAAVFADTFDSKKFSPHDFATAWQLAPAARYQDWPLYSFHWPLSPLPPATVLENDLPINVISAMEHVPWENTFMCLWAQRDLFRPLVDENPDLLPEVLAAALTDNGSRRDRDESLEVFAPQLVGAHDAAEQILDLAREVTSPYYRARALCRLAKHLPGQKAKVLDEAIEHARQIQDPHQRQQVLEQIIRELPADKRVPLIRECITAAKAIKSADDRARAWGRLAFVLPASNTEKLLSAALGDAARVTGEFQRADLLRLLRPYVIGYPELAEKFERVCQRIESPAFRAIATDRPGVILRGCHAGLSQTSQSAAHCWTPLVLYAMASDLDRTERDRAPLAISADDGTGSLSTQRLTGRTAQAVDRLIKEGELATVRSLLPSLVQPGPETLPIVEKWLEHSDRFVSDHAALLLVEHRGLSADLIPKVANLLLCNQDLSRHRVNRVLHRCYVPNEPTMRASLLEGITLEALARVALQISPRAPGAATSISWINAHLLHDDPSLVWRWAQSIDQDDQQAKVSQTCLGAIEAATGNVWRALLSAMTQGSVGTQFAVLKSLTRMLHRGGGDKPRIDDARWEEFLAALEKVDLDGLDERTFGCFGVGQMIQVCLDVLEETDGPVDESVAHRVRELLQTRHGRTFKHVLSDRDEARAALKEVGGLSYANRDLYQEAIAAVRNGLHEPRLPDLLLQWLMAALTEGVNDPKDAWNYERSNLFLLCNSMAQLSPATFSNAAPRERLEPLLTLAAQYHNSFPGRAAAVQMLGRLRQVSPQVLKAIHCALRDLTNVQDAAIESVQFFRRLDDSLLPLLLPELQDDSCMTAYAASRLLTAVGRSERVSGDSRKQIIAALADAVRNPRSQRMIHFGYCEAPVPTAPTLGDAFFAAMLQVAGIR